MYLGYVLCTVNGGGDLVGNVNATFLGEAGGQVHLDTGDRTGGVLHAGANGLAVGGGGGGSVKGPDPVAAAQRNLTAVPDVVQARVQVGCHGAARHRLCMGSHHRRRRHHHGHHHHARHFCHYTDGKFLEIQTRRKQESLEKSN